MVKCSDQENNDSEIANAKQNNELKHINSLSLPDRGCLRNNLHVPVARVIADTGLAGLF